MSLRRPRPDEFAPFYENYIARVPAVSDPVRVLTAQRDRIARLLAVPDSRGRYRYAPGKWTIAELVNHLCDGERVFAYRLMRVARADATPLPGFEEDEWVAASGARHRPLRELVDEWRAVRAATIALVRGLPRAAWPRRGTANGHPVTARSLFYIIVGHTEHHAGVLVARYGLNNAQVTMHKSQFTRPMGKR